ncbi:MAG: nucleoside phosphorylase [Pseudoflavonifractor capillosus]|uniref:nucleoside phosphorylase n=1 Tax=Pseudoflavonifractor capillosus TaxID=106588 RepID=UPI0023FA31A4|nr:nucleoside phosphorylase [Pseudoflavonifractor capillosus]MCI5927398.1 nucleoside phosphorylase [Pseudoflavonifractor capillosus]MDY4660571.1 nucleoside phosphorylase [Pseudoflavonifractor capillosus]
MKKSEIIRSKPSIQLMQERYEYWSRVPYPGLVIDNKPAITQVDIDKVGDYLIYLVRDPLGAYGKDPAERMAERLENAECIGNSGMFLSYTGYYKGAKVTCVSGGSGCPEVELAINDFMEYTNCSTFLRVGTSGGVAEKVKVGDCVITSGVFREDGTSRAYIGDGFPAYCHYEVVTALVQAAEQLGMSYHVGVTACMDSDFVGNGRPSVGGYLQPDNINKLGTYNRAGVLNTDRESSIIMTMCNLFERRGGAVFNVTDNLISGEKFREGAGTETSIDLALEGIAVLHQMDMKKAQAGKENWFPGLEQMN